MKDVSGVQKDGREGEKRVERMMSKSAKWVSTLKEKRRKREKEEEFFFSSRRRHTR